MIELVSAIEPDRAHDQGFFSKGLDRIQCWKIQFNAEIFTEGQQALSIKIDPMVGRCIVIEPGEKIIGVLDVRRVGLERSKKSRIVLGRPSRLKAKNDSKEH